MPQIGEDGLKMGGGIAPMKTTVIEVELRGEERIRMANIIAE